MLWLTPTSKEESTSWESDSGSNITPLLRNPDILNCVHKIPQHNCLQCFHFKKVHLTKQNMNISPVKYIFGKHVLSLSSWCYLLIFSVACRWEAGSNAARGKEQLGARQYALELHLPDSALCLSAVTPDMLLVSRRQMTLVVGRFNKLYCW
jgi:hypothetical protein